MLTPDHVIKSFHNLQKKRPDFFRENWDVLQPLIWQLHSWIDYFSGMPGYDTPFTIWYHKEQRHHRDGINEAVELFGYKFGEMFWDIILEEAETHIYDDFGEIPSQAECSRRYLREKRGW